MGGQKEAGASGVGNRDKPEALVVHRIKEKMGLKQGRGAHLFVKTTGGDFIGQRGRAVIGNSPYPRCSGRKTFEKGE